MRVITRNFSNYYDIQTATQFSAKTAKAFSGRAGFEVVGDEAFLEMITKPAEPEPTQPDTGDPLTDQGGKTAVTDVRPPPPGK